LYYDDDHDHDDSFDGCAANDDDHDLSCFDFSFATFMFN
jgi:hypothetical protein